MKKLLNDGFLNAVKRKAGGNSELDQGANKESINLTEEGVQGENPKSLNFSDLANETKELAKVVSEDISDSLKSISPENWYRRAARACERCSDAVKRDKKVATRRVTTALASKLGAAGASAGIFGAATLVGTASTGTAIGTLSGAAFTSAALAWIGGSVATGLAVVSIASLGGAVGAIFIARWATEKFASGSERKTSELEKAEQRVVEACLALATAFRTKKAAGEAIDPESAKVLYVDALLPLCDELYEVYEKTHSWPYQARCRLNKAIKHLEEVSNLARRWSKKRPNITTGVLSAVFIQLLAESLPDFNEQEILVLEAIRRSRNDLQGATEEEIAQYIQAMDINSLQGLKNNIKGIYHELRFKKDENSDSDEYIVELFGKTNHPGADVIITNTLTNEVREVQLKATSFTDYIKQHNEKYSNIEIFATSEIADQMPGVESTGIKNTDLDEDVDRVTGELGDPENADVLESMGLAAIVSLARNVKVLLRGDELPQAEREQIIKDGAVSAGVAGMVSLLIG